MEYYDSPLHLLLFDLKLCFTLYSYMPTILIPLQSTNPLDELSLTLSNTFDLLVHLFLIFVHLFFLPFLSVCILFTIGTFFIPLLLLFVLANYKFCQLMLNGPSELTSNSQYKDHEDERWFFINGVATGQHWLQSNLDRLALTFNRNIHGIHNPTYGIVFDLFQCLLERDFLYPTQDIRIALKRITPALHDPRLSKVVLLLHSQGGIEGGSMLDMLLADAECPNHALRKLEIYTFASAANHFNNPIRSARVASAGAGATVAGAGADDRHVFAHVEHYANRGDFVSRWGVLRFARTKCFFGTVFERAGTGHLLNQHYLEPMFPLDPATHRVADTNPWAETLVDVAGDGHMRPVRECSRLWAYRNGLSPD